MNVKLSLVAAALACSSSAVMAGAVASGQAGGTLSITDAGGFSWSLDLTPLFGVDTATGQVVIDTSRLGADAVGNWTLANNNGDVKVYNAATDRFDTPSQVVRWHSWERASGERAEGAQGDPLNPWRAQFMFAAGGNIDPYIAYGFSVRNTGMTTQTYSYTQGQSMAPAIAPAYSIYADVGGALVNTIQAAPTANLAPLPGAKLQQVRLGNGGVATVDAGVDVGDPLSTGFVGTTTYGTFAATSSGVGSFDYWTIGTTFTLSGGDVVSLAGFAEITAVPEPGTFAMLMAGVAIVGFMSRRRISR